MYASSKTSAQLQQTALNMEEVATTTDWICCHWWGARHRGDALAATSMTCGRLIRERSVPLGMSGHRPQR
jgi:NTE family protein